METFLKQVHDWPNKKRLKKKTGQGKKRENGHKCTNQHYCKATAMFATELFGTLDSCSQEK